MDEQAFLDAIKKNQTVAIAAHCKVEYSGRAESFLDYGDRLIVIKSDNTVLVHQPTGNAPVNYMKPGNSFILEENVLKVQNLPLKEFLTITFKETYFFNTHKLEEGPGIQLEGTEKDMSDMIYKNPELIEAGFTPVSREEQTAFGFLDVFGHDKEGNLCVIECKRYGGDLKAVDQLRRYVEKVKTAKGIEHVRGILACPKITKNTEKMLQAYNFSFVKVEPPKRLESFKKNQMKLDLF